MEKTYLSENRSGSFFRKQWQDGYYVEYLLHLKETVDEKVLATAVKQIEMECPFYGLYIGENEDKLYYLSSEIEMPAKTKGIEVSCNDNKIEIKYLHAMTDGEGIHIFIRNLLHYYFQIIQGRITNGSELSTKEWEFDIMTDALPAEPPRLPHALLKKQSARLPEKKKEDGKAERIHLKLNRKYFIGKLKELTGVCDESLFNELKPIGGFVTVALTFVLLTIVVQQHPDLQENIGCRCPVNMRRIFNKNNSLRNMSQSQAVLTFEEETVHKQDTATWENFVANIREQISIPSMLYQIDSSKKLLEKTPSDDAGIDYIYSQPFIVSNMGRICLEEDGKYIKDCSYSQKMTVPFSIQSFGFGDKQVLSICNGLEDDIYVERLKSIFMPELISIVVITYNSEKTIIETLESVNEQTYGNLELIVSDDGSTDTTCSLVKEWMKASKLKGRLIESPVNTGISANMNRGLRESSGKLVKFLDGDDLLLPEAIEVFYDYYMKDRKTMWQSRISCFGDEKASADYNRLISDTSFFHLDNRTQYRILSEKNVVISPGLGLFEKEALIKAGGFDERYPLLNDYPLVLKLSRQGICFRMIDQSLIKYRIRKDSVSKSRNGNFYKNKIRFFFCRRFADLIITGNLKELIRQARRYLLIAIGASDI